MGRRLVIALGSWPADLGPSLQSMRLCFEITLKNDGAKTMSVHQQLLKPLIPVLLCRATKLQHFRIPSFQPLSCSFITPACSFLSSQFGFFIADKLLQLQQTLLCLFSDRFFQSSHFMRCARDLLRCFLVFRKCLQLPFGGRVCGVAVLL